MLLKVKRLFFRPLSGKINFFTTLLLTFGVYLFVRSYLFGKSDHDLNDPLAIQNQINNENKIIKPPRIIDQECEINEACSDDSIPYKIISGEGYDKYPIICFNGKLVVSKTLPESKIGRGLNLVLVKFINDSYEVDKVELFDTYAEDASFFRFLKTGTKDGDVILMASYDEVKNSLREVSINFMDYFGSQHFKNIKFRDSYVMIGQRGIPKGKAFEAIEGKGSKDFGAAAKLSGCLKLPLGPITPVPVIEPQINSQHQIVIGNIVKNCGLLEPCPKGEFPVHVFTGINDKDEPKICVDDKYIIGRELNDAGRGMNIVVIGNGKEILKTAHFDTYQEDSTNLEIFLENLYDNSIVIICTFDEASTKLGQLAKNLLFDLGSGLIQNLKHRDAWFMVGQKGISGFSPIEEISYAGPDSAYPVPLNKRFCVPQTLQGMKIRPDPLPIINDKRREFCSKFDGFGDFCFDHNVDKQIRPAPLINKTLEDHPVYSTPILVISSLSHNALRMSLETIIMQPGINADMVHVALDEKIIESEALIKLFGFKTMKIPSSNTYIEQMHKSIEKIWKEEAAKDKDAVIIIEEEIIVSPDFLYFFSQVYDNFMSDENLAAVSSWNPNSFNELNGNEHLVYRTNDFPGLGFMLKKSIYDKYMRNKSESCCNKRIWHNWSLKSDSNLYSLVPDVSRSYRRPYSVFNADTEFLDSLFNRQRKTNLLPFPEIYNLEDLSSKEKYEKSIKKDLSKAVELNDIGSCYTNGVINFPKEKKVTLLISLISITVNTTALFKIIYPQNENKDYKSLKKLCKCFGLFYDENYDPKGLYDGVLRFYAHGNDYILIGSNNELLK